VIDGIFHTILVAILTVQCFIFSQFKLQNRHESISVRFIY